MKKCIHCDQPANNGTMTLCNKHTDKLRKVSRLIERLRVVENKIRHKYYMEDDYLGVDYQDAGPWRSYHVSDAIGDSIKGVIEQLTVAEVDQDGGELDCYGFDDSPCEVQTEILRTLGITDQEYMDAYELEGK